MKRLTPPILNVYTDSQLAIEFDIPHWKIKTACETGQIKAEFVPARTEFKPTTSGPSYVRWSTNRESGTKYYYPAYYTIVKDEALRFEAELFLPSETPEPATPAPAPTMGIDETPEDYTIRRKNEGGKIMDIAWEVYRETSSLEKVGRIFHPDPPSTVPTTYTHRGKKILGLK